MKSKGGDRNEGFDPEVIAKYRDQIRAGGYSFIYDEEDESGEEYVHFYFIGKYEGRDVVYDAVLSTLRLEHQSSLYEIAEHRAASHFPQYKKISYDEDENGNLQPLNKLEEEIGQYMAEIIMDLEEEDQVKVKEQLEIDATVDFGVSIDAVLHLERIAAKSIEKFIKDFNNNAIVLDPTFYSFQNEQEFDEDADDQDVG